MHGEKFNKLSRCGALLLKAYETKQEISPKKIFSGIQRRTFIQSPVLMEDVLCTVDWRNLKHLN